MNIAILGFGTVGTGVYDAIERAGGSLRVTKILDLRSVAGFEELLTSDMQTITNDASIELVVETMGGVNPAYEYVMQALCAKKHVVSANKQLVCEKYAALMKAAADNGVEMRFTASAGGGIPWLFNLQRAKRCDEIEEVRGIVNGTTNFILDAMNRRGADYMETLKEAQKLGYAEADPTADVNGYDAQRKCAISANIAFDTIVDGKLVLTEGIQHISADAARAIKEHPQTKGRMVKLLMRAGRLPEGIYAYVAPALVKADSLEANVPANFNLITFYARYAGVQSYFGQGAGKDPTGTSVAQDILDIAASYGAVSVGALSAKVRNDLVEWDFFLYDGESVWIEHTSVKEIFRLADALRAKGKPVFFAQITD